MDDIFVRQLYSEEKYSGVVKAMEQELPESLDNANLILITADSYMRIGQSEKAAIWYERLVQVQPEVHFMEKLAQIYRQLDVSQEKWQQLAELARVHGAEDVEAVANYQYAKSRGAAAQALVEMLKPIVKNDYDEMLLFELAGLYQELGDDKMKCYYLRKIVSKASDNAVIEKAERMIAGENLSVSKEPVKQVEQNVASETWQEAKTEAEQKEVPRIKPETEPETKPEQPRKSSIKEFFSNFSSSSGKKRRNRRVISSINRYFEDVVGMEEIKQEISVLYNNFNMTEDLRDQGDKVKYIPWNFFIGGERGSGKTLLENILVQIFYDLGMISTKQPIEINAVTLLSNPELLAENSANGNCVIIIRNTEKLYQKPSDEQKPNQPMSDVWLLITQCMENAVKTEGVYFIFSGEREAMESLPNQYPQLKPLIQSLQIPSYSAEELYEIAKRMLEQEGFTMTTEAADRFFRLIKKESIMADFSNGYTLSKMINETKKNVSVRYGEGENEAQLKCLQEDDFILTNEVEESLEDLLAQLDGLTGLESVKEEVRKKIAFFEQRERERKEGKMNKERINLHTIFMGPPGTGKTTVARLLGSIYGKMGILPRGDVFVEVDRAGLIGKYEGHTTDKVDEVIHKAMGGILFIDEAYGLFRGNGENDPYGEEIITTLLKRAEDYRDRMMIIMAGYESEMRDLLASNPGIDRRFPNRLFFESYTEEELYHIFLGVLEKNDYILHPDSIDPIKQLIKRRRKKRFFGNAGEIRNIFEGLQQAVAFRVIGTDCIGNEAVKIRPEDVQYYLGRQKEDDKTLEDYLDELDHMIGLQSVKDEVHNRIEVLKNLQRRRELGLSDGANFGLHTVFLGAPGTGKTTVARLLAKIYNKMELLPDGDIYVEASRSTLVSGAQPANTVREVVDKALGGVLFIDEAYSLVKDEHDTYGMEALNELVKLAEDNRDSMMIILAGYEREMTTLYDYNPGMQRRFSNQLHFEDYSEEELYQIFINMLQKDDYWLDKEAEHSVRELIRRRNAKKNFGNAGGIKNLVEELRAVAAVRTNKLTEMTREALTRITKEDVEQMIGGMQKEETVEDCLKELDDMVGLTNVKKQVRDMLDTQLMAKEKSRILGKPVSVGSLHLVFEGNAGTGKTVVARLIAKIYGRAGLVKDGENFVEASRESFTGKWMGHTEAKAKALVEEAVGGVLFIDEAYNLVNGERDQYGRIALNTLIAPIENNRDDLMVIMAGYPKEMRELFRQNQGLESRMKTVITFEDYTLDELCTIFYYNARKDGNVVEPGLEDLVKECIQRRKEAATDFANARGVRNYYEDVIRNQSVRLQNETREGKALTVEDMLTIRKQDLEG